jgi:hypothetical protein
MDYAALGIVFTFAGMQFVIGWNFHRIYLKLYSDFKEKINKIAEARKMKFQEGLSAVVKALQNVQKGDNPIAPLSYDPSKKADYPYS